MDAASGRNGPQVLPLPACIAANAALACGVTAEPWDGVAVPGRLARPVPSGTGAGPGPGTGRGSGAGHRDTAPGGTDPGGTGGPPAARA